MVFKKTSHVVQWLGLHTPNAGDLSSIPGWGTRSHMLQLSNQINKIRNIKKTKPKNRATIWSSNPTPGHISGENSNSKKYVHSSVHCSPIYNSQKKFSHVRLFATPWIIACQASLSITNSWSPPKPMSIESVMPSNHLILCHPLLLLPSIFPSIRVFSNKSALHIRYWSFSFNISPSNEHPGLISFSQDKKAP